MMVREPVLISTVTAMPGDKLTSLSSICICVRSSGNLGLLLSTLTDQKAALHLDQVRGRALRRLECGKRIVFPCQGRPQPRGVELRRHEVALQMPEFGPAHGRIKLDEHLASADALTVANINTAVM
jgi:hypothetical protein